MARLYSEVVCDVLDTLGFRLQAMPSTIRPLGPARRLSGRVFIARAEVVYAIAEEPYKLEIEGVERMVGGDVLVSSCGKDHATYHSLDTLNFQLVGFLSNSINDFCPCDENPAG